MCTFFILTILINSYNAPNISYLYQIKNNNWDFSKFAQKHPTFHFLFFDKDYYFTFLDNLTKYDLPDYCPNNITSLFSAIVCNNYTKKCYPLISNNSFFAKEIKSKNELLTLRQNTDINNNVNGIKLSRKGESVNIDGQTFYYDITHEFYCNKLLDLTHPSSQNTEIKIEKDEKNTNFYHIILKHKSIYGCPSTFLSTQQNDNFITSNKSTFSNETHFIFEEGDYVIDIDISDYNHATSWSTNVTAYGKINNYQLFYQPSLPIRCPQGFFCDSSDDDSTVWLCSGTNCTSYGILKNGFNVSLAPIGGLSEGIIVNYEGNHNRTTSVTYECDRSLLNDTNKSEGQKIRLPYGLRIFDGGQKIFFSIGVSSSCAKSTSKDPSPFPSVHIPMPKNSSSSQTPAPDPSTVSTSNFFVKNFTHFTTFSLDEISQPLFRGNVPILVDGELGVMYTEFSPWDEVDCPTGWICPAGSQSNIWGCWIASEDDIKNKRSTKNINGFPVPYCHPIGDWRICAHLSPLAPNELDRGVILKFCGAYEITGEMKIECDRYESPSFFSLHQTSAIFHRSLTGPDVTYNLSSSLVCPREFQPILFPSPAPKPTPTYDPTKTVNYHFTSPILNKSKIDTDLSYYSQSQQWTVLRENFTYELSFIIFNPSDQVKCPDSYKCQDFDLANAWKCTKENYCFPIGDSRYNLSFYLNDQNDLKKGVRAVYAGGFAGFKFELNLTCDHSKKDRLLEFADVNLQKTDSLTISVSASTSFVCPVFADDSDGVDGNDKISIGSMIILSLLIFGILYISIGCFLVFLKKGVIEMPNAEFWSEFLIDVKTAALFLAKCGNTESQKERKSYSII